MSAAELLTIAAMEGVMLVLEGGELICRADHQPPADLLTSLKTHKLELIKALRAINETDHEADQLPQNEEKPQHTIYTAATASPDWVSARDEFIHHLMICRACYAPKARYCPSGNSLLDQYNKMSMEVVK